MLSCCFTSTEARWRDGTEWEGDERVKTRPRKPSEKDRRDRGPPPEQWKAEGGAGSGKRVVQNRAVKFNVAYVFLAFMLLNVHGGRMTY